MGSMFLSPLITEHLMDNRFVKLYRPFKYYSALLRRVVELPIGFICDLESVPIVKATCKRGGAVHDYFCRRDSDPVVSKAMAADLYFEVQELRDKETGGGFKKWFRRYFKTTVVRIAPWYFHKLTVNASLTEILGGKD